MIIRVSKLEYSIRYILFIEHFLKIIEQHVEVTIIDLIHIDHFPCEILLLVLTRDLKLHLCGLNSRWLWLESLVLLLDLLLFEEVVSGLVLCHEVLLEAPGVPFVGGELKDWVIWGCDDLLEGHYVFLDFFVWTDQEVFGDEVPTCELVALRIVTQQQLVLFQFTSEVIELRLWHSMHVLGLRGTHV